MRSGLVAVTMAGCSFHAADGVDAPAGDDQTDACVTFSHQLDTCPLPFFGDVTFGAGTYIYNTTPARS